MLGRKTFTQEEIALDRPFVHRVRMVTGKLDEHRFRRLADAFFTELEAKFVS